MLLPVCRRSPFTTGGLRGGLTAHSRRGKQGGRGAQRPRPLASLPSFSHSVSSVSGNHRPHYRLALQLLRSNGAHASNLNIIVQKSLAEFNPRWLMDISREHRSSEFMGEMFQAAQLTHERFFTLDSTPFLRNIYLISAQLNFHKVVKKFQKSDFQSQFFMLKNFWIFWFFFHWRI